MGWSCLIISNVFLRCSLFYVVQFQKVLLSLSQEGNMLIGCTVKFRMIMFVSLSYDFSGNKIT